MCDILQNVWSVPVEYYNAGIHLLSIGLCYATHPTILTLKHSIRIGSCGTVRLTQLFETRGWLALALDAGELVAAIFMVFLMFAYPIGYALVGIWLTT